jgi:hypothetical protein
MDEAGVSRRAYVSGVAFWSPRLPGWELAARAFRGEAALQDPPAPRPVPSMLAPTERRRAPDTVALALEVAAGACASAGLEPTTLPSVFACTYGDLAISDYMSATLADNPALVSPIRFHNSVHNAAAGYWTIGTGCGEPYTALSARGATFGAGMLEALTQVACDGRAVLLVAYDTEARGPLATVVESRGLLAAALVLAPEPGAHALASLEWRLVEGEAVTPARSAAALALDGNGMSGCVPLLEALAAPASTGIRLALQPALQLAVEVLPAT